MLTASDRQRFWLCVPIYNDDQCWPWQGTVARNGYGRFHIGKRRLTASRVLLEMELGRTLAKHERACHRCDNRLCCNPKHLFLGSQTDNMQDCARKGRIYRHGGKRRGEGNPQAQLTAQQVSEIRELKGAALQRVTAERYGISRQTVSAIQTGRRWGSAVGEAETPHLSNLPLYHKEMNR